MFGDGAVLSTIESLRALPRCMCSREGPFPATGYEPFTGGSNAMDFSYGWPPTLELLVEDLPNIKILNRMLTSEKGHGRRAITGGRSPRSGAQNRRN